MTPRKFLLLDGLGALLSAACLAAAAWLLQPYFGMPSDVLQLLAAVAFLFAIYSLSGFFLARSRHAALLKGIAAANLCYCLLTAGMVIYHFRLMTGFGIAYFALECAIIIVLAITELQIASRSND